MCCLSADCCFAFFLSVAVRGSLAVVCCVSFDICCLSFVVWWLQSSVCCLLFVVGCLMFAA